ncbi:MAG: MarR family transcriptional regulator [Candidatus Omnitrophica bacterium]|nr:MarR family transcriptional regulator [Candidatus Omnitrophota bacterium]
MLKSSLIQFSDKMNSILPLFIIEMVKRQVNELYRGKITFPQFLVLELLYKEKESTMTNIARSMSVTTAAATGIVERLVRDGYVVRVSNLKDRRIVLIRLTTKGTDLVEKIRQQRRIMINDIFSNISEEERQNYLNILLKIYNILLPGEKEAKA